MGLAITLNILTDGSGAAYGELIQSHNVVHDYLGTALLIGGFHPAAMPCEGCHLAGKSVTPEQAHLLIAPQETLW